MQWNWRLLSDLYGVMAKNIYALLLLLLLDIFLTPKLFLGLPKFFLLLQVKLDRHLAHFFFVMK